MKRIKKILNIFFIMSLVTILNFTSIVFAYDNITDYNLDYNIESRAKPPIIAPNDYHKPVKYRVEGDYQILLYYYSPDRAVFNLTNLDNTMGMENIRFHVKLETWNTSTDMGSINLSSGNKSEVYYRPNLQATKAYATWTRNGIEYQSEEIAISKDQVHGSRP